MSKFKKGDRVIVLPPTMGVAFSLNAPTGTLLTVAETDEYGFWPECSHTYYYDREVQLRRAQPAQPKYVFSEVPNDEDGQAFIAQLRHYLNNSRYKLRVRGQHLKAGEDWRKYEMGQPIDKSTHLRVYVEEK